VHNTGISENGQSSSDSTCPGDITAGSKAETQEAERSAGKKAGVGYNFVANDFEGVTVLRTTCLECEHTTERKETFYDICVPIMTAEQDSDEGIIVISACPLSRAEFPNWHVKDRKKYLIRQLPQWSISRTSLLQTQRSRVRFPALPDFLSSSGSGTGSTQPL
jgi:hypothetical protein